MKKVLIDLAYCYGIKNLSYTFDFGDKQIYSIYAPNGFMKTSLAKTFQDLQKGRKPLDRVFPDRDTQCEVKDEHGEDIEGENIIVIEPYVKDYESEKTSLLLVNDTLKNEYDIALKEIIFSKVSLEKLLMQLSGLTGRLITPEDEIMRCFSGESETVMDLYEKLFINGFTSEDENWSHIVYNQVFNKDSERVLNDTEFKKSVGEYLERYNDLVESSPILNKGFNHYSAESIHKNLSANNFFEAKHSINLYDGQNKEEIDTSKALKDKIAQEKTRIIGDEELSKKFDKIDKKLSTAGLRTFRDYLFDNREIVPELTEPDLFKKKLWISYLATEKEILGSFIETFKKQKEILSKVSKAASEEKTRWEKVVSEFNSKFDVPFKLNIENQKDVILKGTNPTITFTFDDGVEVNNIDKNSLLNVLSQGESRALYLLNVLFEISARIEIGEEVLIIADDIADSFDYKNKYAIIEYLKEIITTNKFKLILLTHNFDFHRTVSSRLGVNRDKRLFVVKCEEKLEFVQEKYQKSPFKLWTKNLNNPNYLIACIPFVRNLAEYCHHDDEFETLTSYLHLKKETKALTVRDLEASFKKIIMDVSGLDEIGYDKNVYELIGEIAAELVKERTDSIDLENKIIMSVSIRLFAEEIMIYKINDSDFVDSITSNQSMELFNKFTELFPGEINCLNVLGRVNLMTPENIHINAFMYEPILDMSAEHLYALFEDVKKLLDNQD